MVIRVAVIIAALVLGSMAVGERAEAAAAPANTYLNVSFVAISDTTRDTTLSGGSATPVSSAAPSLMSATASGTSATMIFSLYSHPTGAIPAAFWVDTLPAVPIDASGYVHVVLGTHRPLKWDIVSPWEVFYLEVVIAGSLYTPRILVVPPGNVIDLDVVSGELPALAYDPGTVETPPLILSARPTSRAAIAINSKSRLARAIVFGGGGAPGGDGELARMAYRLHVQEAVIEALKAENARLRMPSGKKSRE